MSHGRADQIADRVISVFQKCQAGHIIVKQKGYLVTEKFQFCNSWVVTVCVLYNLAIFSFKIVFFGGKEKGLRHIIIDINLFLTPLLLCSVLFTFFFFLLIFYSFLLSLDDFFFLKS